MPLEPSGSQHSRFEPAPFHVLIVDHDPQSLVEIRSLTETLGYPCQQASDATGALRLIAKDHRIGIIVSNDQMPDLDGLTFLEELFERFMALRPLVTIILAARSDMATAVQAMQRSGSDMLVKPVSLEELSTSLRRASARWFQLAMQFRLLGLAQSASSPDEEVTPAAPRRATPSDEELHNLVARILKDRQKRVKFIDPEILAGPSWDILLDLAAAALKGEPLPTSSVCAAAQVPLSTAHRHVAQLVRSGWVRRIEDHIDKRRTLLELGPEALEIMKKYLRSAYDTFHGNPDHAPGPGVGYGTRSRAPL